MQKIIFFNIEQIQKYLKCPALHIVHIVAMLPFPLSPGTWSPEAHQLHTHALIHQRRRQDTRTRPEKII